MKLTNAMNRKPIWITAFAMATFLASAKTSAATQIPSPPPNPIDCYFHPWHPGCQIWPPIVWLAFDSTVTSSGEQAQPKLMALDQGADFGVPSKSKSGYQLHTSE